MFWVDLDMFLSVMGDFDIFGSRGPSGPAGLSRGILVILVCSWCVLGFDHANV